MSTSDEELFKKGRAAEAAGNPALANIPEKNRSFFQAFAGKPVATAGPGKMNIAGKARPEELAALSKLGWDGVSDLPVDVANKLDLRSDEEVLAEIAKRKNLSISDIEEVPYAEASAAHQADFDNMLSRMESMVKPKIINSKAKPMSAAPVQPTPPAAKPAVSPQPMVYNSPPPNLAQPAPVRPMSVANLLASAQKPAPLPPAAAPAETAEAAEQVAPAAEAQASQTGLAATPRICPRCKLDTAAPYVVTPTKEDIQNRIISFGSAAQGGDGRFKKSYSAFGGTIVFNFRELTTEANTILRNEGNRVMSNDPQIAQLQQSFSLDRIMFRRHCCGLEGIRTPTKSYDLPSLNEWIEEYKGDVDAALVAMEDFVRNVCYNNESVLLTACRYWDEFDMLVRALWSDQSFYNGTL